MSNFVWTLIVIAVAILSLFDGEILGMRWAARTISPNTPMKENRSDRSIRWSLAATVAYGIFVGWLVALMGG